MIKTFSNFDRLNESVDHSVMEKLCKSLIDNQFLKSSSGEIVKVTGIQHEDGSGKKFIVTFAVYDDKQQMIRTQKKYFELK